MRERPVFRPSQAVCLGITPARAGKTLNDDGRCPWAENNPRSCGKDFMIFRFFRCRRDHPRSCGKDNWVQTEMMWSEGLPPARAGKTKGSPGRQQCAEDHPRSCGKDIGIISIISMALGSPPLVRERPGGNASSVSLPRITPARAGKTIRLPTTCVRREDHPRSCGKDDCLVKYPFSCLGSPPLVRERLMATMKTPIKIGITPARAGKTHGDNENPH